MKLTLLLPTLAIGIIISTSYEAIAFGGPPGGPFSNGSYFPTDGTFSAVVRGENLTGTLQFSTTSGSGPKASATTTSQTLDSGFGYQFNESTTQEAIGGVGSTGVAVIYYDGDSYLGNSQGSINSVASTLDINFQANAPGQGEQTIEVQTPVTTQVTTQVIDPITGVVTPVQTEQTEFQVTRQILYFDSLYINGAANCKTSNDFPNQKFEGSGEAEFQCLIFTGDTPFLDAVTMPISVSGVRVSNSSQSFNISNVSPPSVNEFSVLVE
jgi:hypothetical protein